MAGERRLNWGADATDARYRTEDTGAGANFVVANDLDNNTVLLEYDDSRTPSEWVVRGPVDLDGNDLSAGAINATSVTVGSLSITSVAMDVTDNFSGGQTKTRVIGTANGGDFDPDTTSRLVATASPASKPGNDHGYTVDKIYWDSSNSRHLITVTETESAGGGKAHITVYAVNPF